MSNIVVCFSDLFLNNCRKRSYSHSTARVIPRIIIHYNCLPPPSSQQSQPFEMLTHVQMKSIRLAPTIVLTLILIFYLIYLIYLLTCQTKNKNKNQKILFEQYCHETVSFFLGDWIEFRDSDKKYYINIDGVDTEECPTIQHGVLILVFIYVIMLVVFAIITFFEIFMFSTSFTCNNHTWTFCFPSGDNSSERIQNCTMVKSDVICYQLHFNLFYATSVIGTFFTLIKFVITSINKRMIKHYWETKKGKNSQFFALYVVLLLFMAVFLLISCIVHSISLREEGTLILDVLGYIFQYFSVIFSIALGLLVILLLHYHKEIAMCFECIWTQWCFWKGRLHTLL